MVATYKQTVVPASTKQTLENVICDICKKVFKDADIGCAHEITWTGLPYCGETQATHIYIIDKGFNLPEGQSKHGYAYHVCVECFKKHLDPLLRSLGAIPHEYSFDW